jgi:hypothetical protein
MWKRRSKRAADVAPIDDDFREWVTNLPFVVERDHGLSSSVRMYDVDCQPLAQRQTWLILDFSTATSPRPTSVAVVLPRRVADKAIRSGWGRNAIPSEPFARARDRVVVRVDPLAGRQHVEAVVLGSYRSIIDWT